MLWAPTHAQALARGLLRSLAQAPCCFKAPRGLQVLTMWAGPPPPPAPPPTPPTPLRLQGTGGWAGGGEGGPPPPPPTACSTRARQGD